MRVRTESHAAMTFIELLVVIAVIAIMASILMPVYASAKRKAKQARCSANLHQLGHAFALYQHDWDGNWPTAAASPWGDSIRPYVRLDYLKLACPLLKGPTQPVDHVPGYALNAGIYFRTAAESEIQFPVTTVALLDAPLQVSCAYEPDPWATIQRPQPPPESAWKRHDGGANYLFCDQHIKWYKPESVLAHRSNTQDGKTPSFAISWDN